MQITIAVLVVFFSFADAVVAAPNCDEWNTEEYFKMATVEDVKACLAAGAEPMARDGWKYTPLHRAATNNENPEVIKVLLVAGADVMARHQDGNTPLHTAAYNYRSAIDVLLAAGTDPMARNAAGQTPSDLAKANKRLKGTDAYWRLKEARLETPGRGARRSATTSPEPTSIEKSTGEP